MIGHHARLNDMIVSGSPIIPSNVTYQTLLHRFTLLLVGAASAGIKETMKHCTKYIPSTMRDN